ncbi:MAG: nuclear transport factor 2 family protein, partial [Candidatus Rokuibacteriota bacterium]
PTVIAAAIAVSAAPLPALSQQVPEAPAIEESTADAVTRADEQLFDAVFRTCDLEALAALVTEDFEFYHGKWGLSANSRQSFVALIRNRCERQKQGLDFRGRREIVPGSVTTYPIADYGVIQTGVHRFYKIVEGQSDTRPRSRSSPTCGRRTTVGGDCPESSATTTSPSTRRHAPPQTRARPRAPGPSPRLLPKTSEFEIVATVLRIDGDIPAGLPLLVVHFDPLFEVLLRVDRVVTGKPPVRAGERFVLAIHSPTLTYAGRPANGSRHRYRIRA